MKQPWEKGITTRTYRAGTISLNKRSTSSFHMEGRPRRPNLLLGGMFIFGAKPAVTDCDTQVVCKALSELKFLVVVDLFMTATARFAYIVLPVANFLESDLYLNGKKVIDPPGEA